MVLLRSYCSFVLKMQIGSFTDINIYIAGSSDDFYCEACSGREDNIGKDPIEFWGLPKGIDYQLAIALIDGPEPSIMKWGSFNQGRESYKKVDPKLNASPFCPHGNTPLVSAVGAAFDTQAFPSLVKESFSSSGGVGSQPIFFDNNGIRYKKPRNYEKPNVVGPDVSTTLYCVSFVFHLNYCRPKLKPNNDIIFHLLLSFL